MSFLKWLSEEMDPSELITTPETRPSKYGTWLFKEGAYHLMSKDETLGSVIAEVSTSFDLTSTKIFAEIYTKLTVNEEEKECCKKKCEKDRKILTIKGKAAAKQSMDEEIEEALDAAIETRIVKETEINESITGAVIAGVATGLITLVPRLYKMAIEKGIIGQEKERFRKFEGKDAIFNELYKMPITEIQKMLKDRKAMDAFVDKTILAVQKDLPLISIKDPKVKNDIYERLEIALRRIAEAKAKGLAPETAAKEFKTPKSRGAYVGGVFMGQQV